MHSAYRELLGYLTKSRFYLILGGLILLVSWAGPFNTLQRMGFAQRMLYWGVIALASSVFMTYLTILGRRLGQRFGLHWFWVALAGGVLGMLPVMGIVHAVNLATIPEAANYRFSHLFPVVSVSVILIHLVVNALWQNTAPAPVELTADLAATAPERSATTLVTSADPATIPPIEDPTEEILANSLLYAKLPDELGREIVVVQAQDHYIEVTTTQGSAMILMRLSDVEQDLAGLDGMRVHRSWWVSIPHIERMERGTSGPELRLVTGQMVPVSRGNRVRMREILEARGQA